MTRIELVLRLASLAKNTSSGDGGASIRVEVEISNQKPRIRSRQCKSGVTRLVIRTENHKLYGCRVSGGLRASNG